MIHVQFFSLLANVIASGSLVFAFIAVGKFINIDIMPTLRLLHIYHFLVTLLLFFQTYVRLFQGIYHAGLGAYIVFFLTGLVVIYPLFFHHIGERRQSPVFYCALAGCAALAVWLKNMQDTIFPFLIILSTVLYVTVFSFIRSGDSALHFSRRIFLRRIGIYMAAAIPFIIFDTLKAGHLTDNPLVVPFLNFFPFVFTGFGILGFTSMVSMPGNTANTGREDLLNAYRFSIREKEIVELVLEGKNNGEIAELLFISESTVKKHINAIFKKAGVSSRWGLFSLLSRTTSTEGSEDTAANRSIPDPSSPKL